MLWSSLKILKKFDMFDLFECAWSKIGRSIPPLKKKETVEVLSIAFILATMDTLVHGFMPCMDHNCCESTFWFMGSSAYGLIR